MPLISVIVPVYNTAKYLPRCLDSILAQSYRDLDIILLDDGSVDNSYAILKGYANKDNRVRVYRCRHQGIASIRKTGIELAKGEYIGFVDSDDWIESEMYSRLLETIEHNKCDLVSSDIYIHFGRGNDQIVYDNYDKGVYENLCDEIYPTMLHDFAMDSKGLRCYLVTKLFRAGMLKQIVKDIDTKVFYSEDAMILYRYCLACKSIYIMREYFYHYDIFAGATETRPNENEPNNMYRLFSNLKEAFEASPYADVFLPQLYQYAILLNMRVLRGIYGIGLEQVHQWEFYDCGKIYGKRIIVYGAGICGKAFCKDLWKNGHIGDIVAWVDKNFENVSEWEKRYIKEFRHTPIGKAQPVSTIRDVNFDFIVITMRKKSVVEEALAELQEVWDVPREKIVIAKSCKKNLSDMLLSAYV